jgi:NADH dehydrogenase
MNFRNYPDPTKRVVAVVGAGFGGLKFCRVFHAPQAETILFDRTNHHLFQPLLYQVATAGLSAPEIAQPVRMIFSGQPRLSIRMEQVEAVDLTGQNLVVRGQPCHYDYLVLAVGGVTSYFGHPEWERFASGLKSLADAGRIRNDLLQAIERAESETSPDALRRLLTFVIVGGGPTGVEMAGSIAELTKRVLRRDFRRIDPAQARIVLIEAGPRLLTAFHPNLSERARQDLTQMGVEVRLNTLVRDVRRGEVQLDGEILPTDNIVWAAGIQAAPLLAALPVPKDRAGRVKVQPDCSLSGHPNVFAIGDCVALTDAKGQNVPGVVQGAIQMGAYVAKIIATELDAAVRRASTPERKPFAYFDKGSMATIGRARAVAQIGPLHLGGWLAWVSWLGLHLVFLVGLRNRLAVLLQWFYAYVVYRRGARIIWSQKIDELQTPG